MPDIKLNDYELELQDKKTKAELEEEKNALPVYFEKLKLDDEQITRLLQEVKDEFQEIKNERNDAQDEQKWDALDNQYLGNVQEDSRRQFNLDKNITKVKVDKITSLIMQSYFESDPIYSISLRPEHYTPGVEKVCDKQQDFLDYKLDNLPFRTPVAQAVHSAVLKGTGILKIYHDIKVETKKREEKYSGKPVPVTDPATGQQAIDPQTRMPIFDNPGLKQFLSNWPNAPKDYPGYIKRLMAGEDISLTVTYKDVVYNDPRPKCVNLKNFYCRRKTEGYEGLKSTKLTVERVNMSWWELKGLEKQDKFYNIDELMYDSTDKNKRKIVERYKNKDYDILECVYYFKLKEDDEDYVKIVCWIEEEKWVFLGSTFYPLYGVNAYYLPFYISETESGFYQSGVAEFLTDNNIAENAILNLTLEAAYIRNMITPITPAGSDIDTQFLEKRWTLGLPLNARAGEVDFLQKYMPAVDINGMLSILQYLVLGDDDISRVPSGMSGRESPVDPTAPASKTIALLQQAQVGISDFINVMTKSFNEIAYILLQIYYQISKEGLKYATGAKDNPFAVMERNELVARTNIQARAMSFDFDKLNAKKEDLAMFQVVRPEPLVAQNPQAVHALLKNLITGWSTKWKNMCDQILPSLDDLKKQQIMTAAQGVAIYVQQTQQQAKLTGMAPQYDINQLMTLIQQMEGALVTPPPPETGKAA